MSRTALEKEFVSDHQRMIQGLQRLLTALKRDRPADCSDAAAELDRIAGPHIAFEETVLYPKMAEVRGEEFTRQLKREHHVVLEAIRCLLEREEDELASEDKTRLIEQVQTGIDHAESCGALLSHITVLSNDQQAQMLKRLEDLRILGVRWTDLNSVATDPSQREMKLGEDSEEFS